MPQTTKASLFRGVWGLLLIGLLLAALGGYLIYRAENLRQYDCYVWGFNHALCVSGQMIEKGSQRDERCTAHVKPVFQCEEFPETQLGMADAYRYIKGEPVELPPGDRDYRTFHVWGK